jgi:hypothetical protein
MREENIFPPFLDLMKRPLTVIYKFVNNYLTLLFLLWGREPLQNGQLGFTACSMSQSSTVTKRLCYDDSFLFSDLMESIIIQPCFDSALIMTTRDLSPSYQSQIKYRFLN